MGSVTAPPNYYHPLAYNRVHPVDRYSSPSEFDSQYGTFDSSTDRDWRTLKALLAGINALHGTENNSDVNLVARVEFFWYKNLFDPENRLRGAVAFDNTGSCLFHATNALLGYGGSGPGLSEDILRAIGVTKKMFDEANTAVWSKDYTLIFSRQYHSENFGVDCAVPFAPVLDEWEWWQA